VLVLSQSKNSVFNIDFHIDNQADLLISIKNDKVNKIYLAIFCKLTANFIIIKES
jgi:hypothetical protein